MKEKILELGKKFDEKLKSIIDESALENLRLAFIGKKGEITNLMNDFRNVPNSEKKEVGMLVNELKNKVETLISKAKKDLEEKKFEQIVKN